jgi:hypothetical protein
MFELIGEMEAGRKTYQPKSRDLPDWSSPVANAHQESFERNILVQILPMESSATRNILFG